MTEPSGNFVPVQITSSDVTVDFGNKPSLEITGYVYDANGNGKWDLGPDERALPCWTIDLAGADGRSIKSVTDLTGAYSFPGLTPGTYTLTEEPQPGWMITQPSAGPTR